MKNRWLLEQDNEGEIYTLPSVDRATIDRVIGSFDGSARFYCCLCDTSDDSCLWCVGEPDRRIVEGRLIDGPRIRHFVLRRSSGGNRPVKVCYGAEPAEVVTVASAEILTAADALSVFDAFHRDKSIPGDFEARPKVCLFGSNSSR
ncbi:MAG: hypothetical protein U0793_10730 [Gemmataceae bacterium]